MSETEKFTEWYEAAKAEGLVDVKFFPEATDTTNVEDFCKELNHAIASKVVEERTDVF